MKNAKESAALSEAKTTYTEYLSETLADSDNETDVLIKSGDYYFTVTNGQLDTKPATNPDTATYTEVVYASAKATDGTWDTKANVFIYAKPTTTGGVSQPVTVDSTYTAWDDLDLDENTTYYFKEGEDVYTVTCASSAWTAKKYDGTETVEFSQTPVSGTANLYTAA